METERAPEAHRGALFVTEGEGVTDFLQWNGLGVRRDPARVDERQKPPEAPNTAAPRINVTEQRVRSKRCLEGSVRGYRSDPNTMDEKLARQGTDREAVNNRRGWV